MIDHRNFVRVPSKARLWESMGPGALRRNEALFRGQRNFWDAADDISADRPLGLRGPAPRILVNDVWNAFPL